MVILLSTFWGLLAYQTEFWPALYMCLAVPKHLKPRTSFSFLFLHCALYTDSTFPIVVSQFASHADRARASLTILTAAAPHRARTPPLRSCSELNDPPTPRTQSRRRVRGRSCDACTQRALQMRRRGTDASEPSGAPLPRPAMRQRPFASLCSVGRAAPAVLLQRREAAGGNRLWTCGQKSDERQRSVG